MKLRPSLLQNVRRGLQMLSRTTKPVWDANFGSVVFAVELVIAAKVVRLAVMTVVADIDGFQYVDANNENVIGVVLKTVVMVVAAVVKAVYLCLQNAVVHGNETGIYGNSEGCMSERYYGFVVVDYTDSGYWDADSVVGYDYGAEIGIDASENDDIGEQLKQGESQEENDVDVGRMRLSIRVCIRMLTEM